MTRLSRTSSRLDSENTRKKGSRTTVNNGKSHGRVEKQRTQRDQSKTNGIKVAEESGSHTETPVKVKKTPKIKIIGSKTLAPNWADHEPPCEITSRNLIKIKAKNFRIGSTSQSHENIAHDENHIQEDPAKEMSETESETSDTMCLDDDGSTQDRVQELMTQAGNKSPDQVYNIVSKWGKGTECVIEWGFRQNTTNYKSNGIVVGRTVRKSTVKVKISYEPALGHDGPCGFLYLPPSNKIRICNLQATKLFKIEMPTQNLEEQAEHISCEDGQSDLDPLPPMAQIDPSFAVHVVAIFRAIIRGYAAAELDSEKEAIWHKFLNAPRDSLATVRQAIRRNQKVAHVRNDRENLEARNLSAEQRAELEIDRRSIRHALQTARAGNLGKATRILDNVYKESALTPEEKVRKLQQLHPEGDAIRIPEADFPRTGVVEKSEVRLATEKLSRGASPGPTGLSESMMRLLVDDEESCLSLCHMLRDVINGEVPLNVRKRLTRCGIIALAKPQNGIRPIAMGDTILKICGSILLQRHENALQNFFSPIQRGILQKNACESIVHELLNEYEEGHAILTVDFSNAYNTPQRNAIAEALLGNPIFKPFMRLFYLEYGIPSELLFFAHNALFATIESSSGIRQGSALSSMYFCALLQGPLRELMHLYPDVKIRAYQDDVTLSSKNVQALEAAFFYLREIAAEMNLRINFQKCDWFQKNIPNIAQPPPLEKLGVNFCSDAIKVLGAYVGTDQVVENLLIKKMEKHKCLFRRLLLMGPSNLSLAILRRCTIPRHDYHLRVHRPGATFQLAQSFENQVNKVLEKWSGADANALKLAALPQKLGGLGLISSTLKQKHFFETASKSIDEHLKPNNAPVDQKGSEKAMKQPQSRGEAARKLLKKKLSAEHDKQITELQKDSHMGLLLKRTKESNMHLESTSNYVNPYLFRYTLMMRLGIGLHNAPADVICPGCCGHESPTSIIPHVAGCSRCSGMNCTRKHSHIVRYLADLCSKAGLPCIIEPRIHSSFFCTKCKCSISAEVAEHHPCKARRIRSGPDLAIMWPHMGEVLYDFTVVHTCCSSYAKQTSTALMQHVLDKKFKKYVTEKGVESDSFRCLAASDCGLLHNDTKTLLKALSQRAKQKYEDVREAFQLEIEKLAAYTIVSQLREYIPEAHWIGGLRQ